MMRTLLLPALLLTGLHVLLPLGSLGKRLLNRCFAIPFSTRPRIGIAEFVDGGATWNIATLPISATAKKRIRTMLRTGLAR